MFYFRQNVIFFSLPPPTLSPSLPLPNRHFYNVSNTRKASCAAKLKLNKIKMNQSICGDVASIKIDIWVLEEEERNSMKANILNVFTRLLDSKCLHIYQSIRQPHC